MTLQHPELLWSLLALPLLWWWSRPPAPRQRVLTAHLEQWQLAMKALRRRPPRGSTLRFLLLAAALVAAALAAAGPATERVPGPERLVVLLDGSASMAARSGDATAFARARSLLCQGLDAVPEHVDVTLLRCGGDLRRRYGEAARRLNDIGEPGGALAVDLAGLASSLRDERTAVWVCTDGQGQVRLPERCGLDVLDARGVNASVVDVRVVDRWPLPGLDVEVDVVAHAAAAAEVRVLARGAIEGDEERVAVDWRDGQVATARFELRRQRAGGALELAVELADDVLPEDDAWTLQLPELPAPRVAVLASGDAGPFAEVAATALAAEVGGRVVPPTAGGQVGLLLVDGGEVDLVAGAVRAMTFGARLQGQPEPEAWPAPAGVDWDRRHVVTRGLDLSELRIAQAWRGVLPDGEALLWSEVDGEREPLAVLVQGDGMASLHFAFRLQDANLPLLAAFPQLLRRGFVRSYDAAASLQVDGRPPPEGERDLRYAQAATSRPLAAFGAPPRSLARWFVAAGLLALALRAFLR